MMNCKKLVVLIVIVVGVVSATPSLFRAQQRQQQRALQLQQQQRSLSQTELIRQMLSLFSLNSHVTVDACTCTEKGNTYRSVSSNNCRSFTQETDFIAPTVHNCPKGLQFDVQTCVCNYPQNTACAANC